MDTTKTIAALFDFDGVIMDTETQYTVFWDEQGRKYLNEEDFGRRIKGQTLTQIYEKYFSDLPEAQQEITATPENSYVFEDSFHGLQAGMTSGATVIGLATTNTREAITGKAHYIIDDFSEMTFEHLLALHR